MSIPGVVADSADEDNSTQKLLDSIAEVSDKASQQCGFVYDAESGLYYDIQSGMYYDQVVGQDEGGGKGWEGPREEGKDLMLGNMWGFDSHGSGGVGGDLNGIPMYQVKGIGFYVTCPHKYGTKKHIANRVYMFTLHPHHNGLG